MGDALTTIKRVAKRSVTENLGLKLIALVISLGLFAIVRFQEKVERWIDVEVIVRAPPPATGIVMTSDPPDRVRVFLRGRESLVDSVREGETPQVVMDLSSRRDAGSTMFYFEREMFDFPSGIDIVDTKPEAVLVRTERIVTRKLPVRVRTFGRLKGGAELEDDPVVNPDEVVAFGAASIVRQLGDVQTEEVDIEGLGVGEHEIKVPLKRIEGLGFNLTGDATVTVKVRWTPGQRMLSGLLVKVVGADQPVEVRPPEVAVSLSGSQVALDKLDPAKVEPTIEITPEKMAKAGVFPEKVVVKGLPSDVEVKSVAPATVLVKVPGPAGKTKKSGGQAK
jgi:YbbR domain-containing protein